MSTELRGCQKLQQDGGTSCSYSIKRRAARRPLTLTGLHAGIYAYDDEGSTKCRPERICNECILARGSCG